MSNQQNIINQLIGDINDVITTNGNQEITGEVLRELLINVVSSLNNIIQTPEDFLLNQYPAYNAETTYTGGEQVIVKHNGLLWIFISATDQIGVTPGTNFNVWDNFNALQLAHTKDHDAKLAATTANEVTAVEIRSFIDAWVDLIELGLTDTDQLDEGTQNLYFTVARVRATQLTGLSVALATAIGANDSVLSALGKLQGQINTLPTPASTTTNLTEGNQLYFTALRVLTTVLSGYEVGPNEAVAATDQLLAAIGKLQGQIDALEAASGITEAQLKDTARTFNSAQRMKWVALTDAATITPDFNAGNNFEATIQDNRTFANPTNLASAAGQSGVIQITMGSTADRTISWGDKYFGDEADYNPSGTVGNVTEYGYSVNGDASRISLYKRGPQTLITV